MKIFNLKCLLTVEFLIRLLVGLMLFTSSVYFYDSGGFQVSMLFFMLSFLALIFFRFKDLTDVLTNKLHYPFYIFISITIGVNLFWGYLLNDLSFLMDSLTFIYFFLVLILGIIIYQYFNEKFLHDFFWIIFITNILQLLTVLYEGDLTRPAALFNNPNQLGHWGLLSFVASLYLKKNNIINGFLINVNLLLSFFIIFACFSRAAIGGLFIGIIIEFIFDFKSILKYIFLTAIFIVGIGFVYPEFLDFTKKEVIMRFNENDEEDSIIGRGYKRIFKYPKYLILGAGQKRNERFYDEYEFHSSLGMIIFSYGILGFFFFLSFFYSFFKEKWFNLIYFVPLLFFSLYHYSLRMVLLWLLFAIIITENNNLNIHKKNINI